MATTMTEMNGVKFVRQVHMPVAPLVQTGALQQRAYATLMSGNAKWVQCPDGLTSALPKNDPLQIGCSQTYDAFKYGSDCVAASGSQGMWAGMAAYRFQMPSDVKANNGKDAAKLLALTADVFTDKFLLGGVAVSAGFSLAADPDDVGLLDVNDQPFPLPYATKVAGYEAPVMGDLAAGSAEGTNKYETLTLFDSTVEGGGAELPAPGAGIPIYLWVLVRLFDYTELKWEYWIEGSAGLDANTVTVTWHRDVVADPADVYVPPNFDLAYSRILPVETTWCNRKDCYAGWFMHTVTADDPESCLRPLNYSSTLLDASNPYPDSPADIDTRVMLDNLMYFYSSPLRVTAFTRNPSDEMHTDLYAPTEYWHGSDIWRQRPGPSMYFDEYSAQNTYWNMPATVLYGYGYTWPNPFWTTLYTVLHDPGPRFSGECWFHVPAADGVNWHMILYTTHLPSFASLPEVKCAWITAHSKWDLRVPPAQNPGGCWTVVDGIDAPNTTGGRILYNPNGCSYCTGVHSGKSRLFFTGYTVMPAVYSTLQETAVQRIAYWEHTDAAAKSRCSDMVREIAATPFATPLYHPTLTELADGTVLVAGIQESLADAADGDATREIPLPTGGGTVTYRNRTVIERVFGANAEKAAYIVTVTGAGQGTSVATAAPPYLPHHGAGPVNDWRLRPPPTVLLQDGRVLFMDWRLKRYPVQERVGTIEVTTGPNSPYYVPEYAIPDTVAQQIIETFDPVTGTWSQHSITRDLTADNVYINASPYSRWRGVVLANGNVFMYGYVNTIKRTVYTKAMESVYPWTIHYATEEYGPVTAAWCVFDANTSTMSEFHVGCPAFTDQAAMLLLQDHTTIMFAESGRAHAFDTITQTWTQLSAPSGVVNHTVLFAPPTQSALLVDTDVGGSSFSTASSYVDGNIKVNAVFAARRVFAHVPGQFKPTAVRLRINPTTSTNVAARIVIVADTRGVTAPSPLVEPRRIKDYYSGVIDPADAERGITVVGQAMVPFAGHGSTLDIAITELPKGQNMLWIIVMPTGTWGQALADEEGELARFEVQITKTLLVGASK